MKRLFGTRSCVGRRPTFARVALASLLAGTLFISACGGDEHGGAGAGGSAGSAGGVGAAGSAGAGMAGNENVAVAARRSAPSNPTGSIQVLAGERQQLLGPTAAALRGQNLWVANGQLDGLFAGAAPRLPFSAVSIPFRGAAVAAAAIELQGKSFYPEGIAAAADGTLYIGSVGQSTIVRVPVNSTSVQRFLADGVAQRAVIGLTVDDDRQLVWFCDSNPTELPRRGAVVGVSMGSGQEVVRHELLAPAEDSLLCNDLLIDPHGNLWVTESIAGILYRIDARDVLQDNAARIWMHGGLAAPAERAFGANGLALAGGLLIVANTGHGALFAVDPASTNPLVDARQIRLFEGNAGNVSLCAPDGLLAVTGFDDEVVVVESGACALATPRVVRIRLDLN